MLLVPGEPLYICGAVDGWQWGLSRPFPLSGPVCLLMYLSPQLVQIASSIIGLRYENMDSCIGAQSHCYKCNLDASWGRPSSEVRAEEGGRVGYWCRRSRKELLCTFIFYDSCFFIIRDTAFPVHFLNNITTFPLPYLFISLLLNHFYASLYIFYMMCGRKKNLTSKQWFSYCLSSRTYGHQHGGNQHRIGAVKLKMCLWLYSHAKSLIPHVCLLASLNNVWRGIVIRLSLIKDLPICITQGHSLSVHRLRRPSYLLAKLNFSKKAQLQSLNQTVFVYMFIWMEV